MTGEGRDEKEVQKSTARWRLLPGFCFVELFHDRRRELRVRVRVVGLPTRKSIWNAQPRLLLGHTVGYRRLCNRVGTRRLWRLWQRSSVVVSIGR